MRSNLMRAVKNRGSKSTEWVLRSALCRAGLRGWQMHVESLPGTPDFVFTEHRVTIFVDGCFWHGCGRCYRRPITNRSYWDNKLEMNRARDRRVDRLLRRRGWRVIHIWQHELTRGNEERLLKRIEQALASSARN